MPWPARLACAVSLCLGTACATGPEPASGLPPGAGLDAPTLSALPAGGEAVVDAPGPSARTVSMAHELGQAALRERRFDDAAAWFARAADANPGLAEAYNGAVLALVASGRTDEAQGWLQRAEERSLQTPDLQANRQWLRVAQAHRAGSAQKTPPMRAAAGESGRDR